MRPLRALLALPEAQGAEGLDDAETSVVHRRIIESKPFLKRLYAEFYGEFVRNAAAHGSGTFVELGSGGGFLPELLPGVVTSDVVPIPGVAACFSAEEMPFEEASVAGIYILNCFHHFPDPEEALREFARVLEPGGSVVMIEPANSPWGRFVYTRFHHEPFDPSGGWEVEGGGRLTAANGALPWVVFVRDRARFAASFPELEIVRARPHTPLRYLLSGGVSMRQLVPGWSFGAFQALETALSPLAPALGMFLTIELRKRPHASSG